LDKQGIASVLVALITAFGIYAAARAGRRATPDEEVEEDAYTRARKIDVETINRQAAEITAKDTKIENHERRIAAQDRKITEQGRQLIEKDRRIHELEISLGNS
jgi:uncharacterized protein (DUF3084 family)